MMAVVVREEYAEDKTKMEKDAVLWRPQKEKLNVTAFVYHFL